ncbi:MAG: ATP-binding protein [Terriglobia bacterium]
MSANHVVGIIAAVATLTIGLALYAKSPRKGANRAFLLIALGMCGWIVGVVLLETTFNLFWFSFLSFFAIIMGNGFAVFSRVFPSRDRNITVAFYATIFSPAVLMGLLVLVRRDLFAKGILARSSNGSLQLELGPLSPLIVGYAVAIVSYATFNLARKYVRSRGLEKLQLKYLFLGFSLFFVTVVSANLILPQFRIYQLKTFGPAMSLIFVGFTAYAIAKHRLLDLQLVVLRSLAYSLTLALVITGYALGTLLIASAYPEISPSSLALAALALALFSVAPLRALFVGLTDALFARVTYDPQELTKSLAETLSTSDSLDGLSRSTVRLLKEGMRLKRVAFVATSRSKVSKVTHEGFEHVSPAVWERVVKLLDKKKAMLVLDELDASAQSERLLLEEIRAEAVLPVLAEHCLGGFLVLGGKASGAAFTVRDFKMLEVVASQVSAGLQKVFSIQAERKLREMQAQLVQAGKMTALGTLAAGVAHELNQPLTGIKGFGQVVLRDLGEDDPSASHVERILAQADRMIEIIEGVGSFSRRRDPRKERTDINKSVIQCLNLMETEARNENIQLVRRFEEDLPEIKADADQLSQVCMNLLSNALHSTRHGGATKKMIKVETFISQDRRNVCLTVADTGHGISEDDRAKVFDPFFTTKSKDGGLGLGLSITHGIVENHGGTIRVESEEGNGAIFKISLPAAVETEETARREDAGR